MEEINMREEVEVNGTQVVFNSGKDVTLEKIGNYFYKFYMKKLLSGEMTIEQVMLLGVYKEEIPEDQRFYKDKNTISN